MKRIIQFSVNNKFALWLLTIIITVAGIYAGTTMKLETLPDITTPTVSVTTIYPGATPEQVLDEVSRELESKVENLGGVETVRSSSFQNASNLQIDYSFSTDMDEAEQKVKEALANVELPEGAQEPQVSRISFDAFPVIGFAVSDEKRSLSDLTKLVESELQPKLEGIEGAQTVQIAGQEIRRIEIQFDEKKLQQYGLTEENVKQLIQANDSRLALGLYELGDQEQAVVLDGKATTVNELKNLRLPYTPQPSAETGQASPGAGAQAPTGAPAQATEAPASNPAAPSNGCSDPSTDRQIVATGDNRRQRDRRIDFPVERRTIDWCSSDEITGCEHRRSRECRQRDDSSL